MKLNLRVISAKTLLAVSIMTLVLLYLMGSYRITDITLQKISDAPQSKLVSIKMPFTDNSAFSRGKVVEGLQKQYLFSIHTIGYQPQLALWRITPSGCISSISANGKQISLDRYHPAKLCGKDGSFYLNVRPYLRNGSNKVDISLTDYRGGYYGLNLQPVLMLFNQNLLNHTALTYIIIIGLFGFILLQLQFDRLIVCASMLAMAIFIYNLFRLQVEEFAPDWWGHIEYVKYILKTWQPPHPDSGWVTYHPPVYYYIAAIAEKIGKIFDAQPMIAARSVSLVATGLFVIYGMLLMRETIQHTWLQRVCMLALLFWPIIGVLGCRLSNEAVAYPFWAGIYYHLYGWYKTQQPRKLVLAITHCSIMMLIKASAIVPLATVGAFCVFVLFTNKLSPRYFLNRKIVIALLVLTLCTAAVFGRIGYYKIFHNSRMGMLISNQYKDPFRNNITQKLTWEGMTFVNFNDLSTKPYLNTLYEGSGRQYFWNSYVKTALFGFFEFPIRYWASVLDFTLLFLILYALAAAPFIRPYNPLQVYLGISLMIGFGAHITNRITSMNIGASDARFTFPIIILFIIWIASVIEESHKRKLYGISYIGGISLVFFTFGIFHFDMLFIDGYKKILRLL